MIFTIPEFNPKNNSKQEKIVLTSSTWETPLTTSGLKTSTKNRSINMPRVNVSLRKRYKGG
jgi:hypothetical protein